MMTTAPENKRTGRRKLSNERKERTKAGTNPVGMKKMDTTTITAPAKTHTTSVRITQRASQLTRKRLATNDRAKAISMLAARYHNVMLMAAIPAGKTEGTKPVFSSSLSLANNPIRKMMLHKINFQKVFIINLVFIATPFRENEQETKNLDRSYNDILPGFSVDCILQADKVQMDD
jgi:hypothetical protein